MTFYSNGASIGTGTTTGGVATLTTSALPSGTDKITAYYPGDSGYATSTTSTSSTEIVSQPATPAVQSSTCSLYGGSGYANNWIGINFIVILVSLTVIAFVYTIANFMPSKIRSKLSDAVKSELSQILLSAVIIVILIGSAQLACNLSAIYSVSYVPRGERGLTPFQYADSYIGNLATVTGVSLLTNIYSLSIAYQVEAQIVYQALDFTSGLASGLGSAAAGSMFSDAGLSLVGGSGLIKSSILTVSLILPDINALSGVFTSLSSMYVGVFSPLITLATGMLFIQFLLLEVMQYTAFTTILPVAILMRSLAFTGTSLRNSANALLAIAIAAYLVYPLTVALDYNIFMNYALPNAGQTYQLQNININSFFSSLSGTGVVDAAGSAASLMTSSVSSYMIWPWDIMNAAQTIITHMAQFIFQSVVLFAVNIAITIGFATGLAKALNSGVEGAGSFWNSI